MEKEPCCIAKIRQGIMKDNPNVTAIYFKLANIENVLKKPYTRVVKTGQAIEVYQNVTMKKSGQVRNKKLNTFMTHSYCPFCGKKYELD